MWVHRLADADATCGGKAVGLSRLITAGLPVPEGFVIAHLAFRQAVGPLSLDDEGAIGHALAAAADRLEAVDLPAQLVGDVQERADALGLVAVRSSATIEDGTAGAAAGVFSSRGAVPPREVWLAIRTVWTSALTPLAASYARHRGNELAIGVIVQRHISGERVTVYTRPPGNASEDTVVVQRGARPVTMHSRESVDPIITLAIRAEAAIRATATGADVELVVSPEGALWVVQARPVVRPVWRPLVDPPTTVLAGLVADGRSWALDVAHNPDPLSTSQTGLVERVERAQIAPWSLRVCAGYLYAATRGQPELPQIASRADLDHRAAQLEAQIEGALGADVPSLGVALERYLAFYRIWATELHPLIAAARRTLTPEQLAGARPSAVEATLIAAARGELDETAVAAHLGVLAPAWDVAVPTFGERPGLVHDAIARAGGIARPPPDPIADDLARGAADLAERDDLWFARAQWLVRRALLTRATELGIAAADVFWLPLDDLLAPTIDLDDARRRAAAARAASSRAAMWRMPVVVGGPAPERSRALHGVGLGPRVTGRVVRFVSLASAVAVGTGDIVVTRAVTPALAVLVVGCAALVSETGSLLDHGAALARELGITCVVGCADAWSLLGDGVLVTVDGEAGTVVVGTS